MHVRFLTAMPTVFRGSFSCYYRVGDNREQFKIIFYELLISQVYLKLCHEIEFIFNVLYNVYFANGQDNKPVSIWKCSRIFQTLKTECWTVFHVEQWAVHVAMLLECISWTLCGHTEEIGCRGTGSSCQRELVGDCFLMCYLYVGFFYLS